MSAPAGAFVPKVGDPVAAIDTPALVIDLDAMERNLAAMADFARARGVRLRPHAKMHKCAAIARLQRAAGAVGVCVQKTSEAEALAAAGVDDIYISNEVIDRAKLARVAAPGEARCGWRSRSTRSKASSGWPRRCARPARAIDVFVEIDVGHGRCGAPAAAAGSLAHRVVSHAPPDGGLRFAGLQAYHGAAQHLRGAERAGGGVAPRGLAGERGPGRDHRAPASPARWSPAPAPAPSRSTSPAASGASCRRAATCSWTATTPTTRRRRTRRASSMRSSSRAR